MKIQDYANEIKTLLYSFLIYLKIDHDIAIIVVVLIFTDMFIGAIKSVSLPTMKFSIAIFWQGLIKKSILLTIVMVLALTAKGLGFDDFKLMVTTVIKIMILNECISIFNSCRSILDKKQHKSSDFISKLIEIIGKYLLFYVEKLFGILDNDNFKNR
jgi:hypothetical protein